MTPRTTALMGGVIVAMTVAGAMPAEAQRLRPIRSAQAVPDLGLTISVSADDDGSLVLTATAGDLTVHKRVFADGTYAVRIQRGRDDVVISAVPGRTTVRSSGVATDLRAEPDASFEGRARRVRESLARSETVQRFRQLAATLDQMDEASPEALALRITGAVVAELSGDPAAAQRLSRAILRRHGATVRNIQTGSTCYDRYQAIVSTAARQLDSCLGSFNAFNPMRNLCVFVWTLQVESAWFQFLSCSSIPLK